MATSARSTKMSASIKQTVIAFLAAVALVISVGVPVAIATNGSDDNTVSVTLEHSNAYIQTADGQSITSPSGSKLKLPVGSQFKFKVMPVDGYEVQSVTAIINSQKDVISPDANDYYIVPASKVKSNFKVVVKTEKKAVAQPKTQAAVPIEEASDVSTTLPDKAETSETSAATTDEGQDESPVEDALENSGDQAGDPDEANPEDKPEVIVEEEAAEDDAATAVDEEATEDVEIEATEEGEEGDIEEIGIESEEAEVNEDNALNVLADIPGNHDPITVTVNGFNNSLFDGTEDGYATIRYSTSPQTFTGATYWKAYKIEKQATGEFTVTAVYNVGESKNIAYGGKNEFVLAIYDGSNGANTPEDIRRIQVGDVVSLGYDPATREVLKVRDTSKKAWKKAGYGTLTFSTPTQASYEASDKPTVAPSADTKDIITVNLYDYSSAINSNGASKFPGFQWPGGASATAPEEVLDSIKTSYLDLNYGDNIVADCTANDKADRSSVTQKGAANNAAINKTVNSANSPLSGALSLSLVDGYPALADGASIGYLFGEDGNTNAVTKVNSSSINGLFQQNSETGAYTFDSRKNHAQYEGGNFVLYDQTITSNHIYYPFGNFLPFNDINKAQQSSKINSAYLAKIMQQADSKSANNKQQQFLAAYLSKLLEQHPDKAAEYYTNLYFTLSNIPNQLSNADLSNSYTINFDEATNFFFGMDMEMNFQMPKNAKTGNGNKYDIVFNFAGDDDVMVYVDGALLLDLSGIHRHVGGDIDFTNGKIYYYSLDKATGDVANANGVNPAGAYKTVTFREALEKALKDASGEEKEKIQTAIDSLVTVDGVERFKDYSMHEFKFYYMERGSGSGVCRMNFNFPVIDKKNIAIQKNVEVSTNGIEAADNAEEVKLLGNPDFYFQVYHKDQNSGKSTLVKTNSDGSPLTYKLQDASGQSVQMVETITTPSGDKLEGIIKLKDDQVALIEGFKEDTGEYFVREVGNSLTAAQYDVEVNGTGTTEVDSMPVGFTGNDSVALNVTNGNLMFEFNNKVPVDKLGKLQIEKKVDGRVTDETFSFEVKIDGKLLDEGTKYTVTSAKTGAKIEDRTVETAGRILLKGDEIATISNLLAGSTYTVSENASPDYEGIVGDPYYVDGNGDQIETPEGLKANTILATDDNAAAADQKISKTTVTNTLFMNVPVHKEWVTLGYEQANDLIKPITVQLYKVVGDKAVEDGVEPEVVNDAEGNALQLELNAGNNWVATFSGLPRFEQVTTGEGDDATSTWENIHYTVKEVDSHGNPVTKLDGFLAPEYGAIAKDDEGNLLQDYRREITNTFDPGYLGALKVTKEMQSSLDEDFDAEFTFNVAFDEEPVAAGTTYTMVKRDGSTTTEQVAQAGAITLKGGETAIFADITPGTSYKVVEIDIPEGFAQVGEIKASYVAGANNEAIKVKAEEGTIVAGEQVIDEQTVREVAVLATATNKPVVNVPVRKEWGMQGYENIEGITAPVQVKLLKDVGSGAVEVAGVDPLTLGEENEWSATFENLSKFEQVDGAWVEVQYSVEEVLVNEDEEVASLPGFQEPTYELVDGVWVITNNFSPTFILRKALVNPNETLEGTTFIYEVTASSSEGVIYDKIFTIEGNGQETISDIPGIAETVTIEEVYTGASYEPAAGTTNKYVLTRQADGTYVGNFVDANGNAVGAASTDASIGYDEANNTFIVGGVTFTNDYNGERKYGSSVTNEYEKSTSGWVVEQNYSNKND